MRDEKSNHNMLLNEIDRIQYLSLSLTHNVQQQWQNDQDIIQLKLLIDQNFL